MKRLDLDVDNITHLMTELVAAPLAITAVSGKFLWVNQAFASMLDYSPPELTSDDSPTWMDLTADKEDLENDLDALKQLSDKTSDRYILVKKYRAKTGRPIPVRIVVERYPRVGDDFFFVVTATELNNGYKDAFDYADRVIKGVVADIADKQNQLIERVSQLQKEQYLLKQNVIDTAWVGKIVTDMWDLVKNRPKIALTIVLVFSLLIFGDKTIAVLENLKRAIGIVFTQVQNAPATVLPTGEKI